MRECQATAAAAVYLDGGDVERCCNAKDGHDDRLVLLVDEDLHFSDVLFSRHLRDVLVGHVGFPGSEVSPDSKISICHMSDGRRMVGVAAADEIVDVKNKESGKKRKVKKNWQIAFKVLVNDKLKHVMQYHTIYTSY